MLQVVESYCQEAFLEDSNNKCRLQIHTLAHHCKQCLKLPQQHWRREKLGNGVGCRAIAGVVGHDVAMVIGGRFVVKEWCN